MACKTCPFAFTDESEMVQNYGCLPSPYDIVQMKHKSGHNWGCHSNEKRICKGFVDYVELQKTSPWGSKLYHVDTSKGNLISYETWYHKGEAEALREAEGNELCQK